MVRGSVPTGTTYAKNGMHSRYCNAMDKSIHQMPYYLLQHVAHTGALGCCSSPNTGDRRTADPTTKTQNNWIIYRWWCRIVQWPRGCSTHSWKVWGLITNVHTPEYYRRLSLKMLNNINVLLFCVIVSFCGSHICAMFRNDLGFIVLCCRCRWIGAVNRPQPFFKDAWPLRTIYEQSNINSNSLSLSVFCVSSYQSLKIYLLHLS